MGQACSSPLGGKFSRNCPRVRRGINKWVGEAGFARTSEFWRIPPHRFLVLPITLFSCSSHQLYLRSNQSSTSIMKRKLTTCSKVRSRSLDDDRCSPVRQGLAHLVGC